MLVFMLPHFVIPILYLCHSLVFGKKFFFSQQRLSFNVFFLLSALLRELGSLCWDRGYGAFESTLDTALLGSSRAGTDQTHVSGEA